MTESLLLLQNSGMDTPAEAVPELDDVLKIRGVGGAFLIRNDGSVVIAAGCLEQDNGGLSSSSLRLVFESGMIADRIRDGPLSQIFLEFENSVLMIQEADNDRFIAVIASPDANIGRINYHMKRQRKRPVPAA
jgi:predicted regulator of Ras-like GTPase activity (Roadblock/LC7/MglB family)